MSFEDFKLFGSVLWFGLTGKNIGSIMGCFENFNFLMFIYLVTFVCGFSGVAFYAFNYIFLTRNLKKH